MRRLHFSALLLFVAVMYSAAQAPATPAKRSITEKDLFRFQWIGDPQVSPDGSQRRLRQGDRQREEGWIRDIVVDGRDRRRSRSTALDQRQARLRSALVAGWQVDRIRARQRRAAQRRQAARIAACAAFAGRGRGMDDHRHAARGVAIRCGRQTASASPFSATPTPMTSQRSRRRTRAGKPEHESDVKVITRAVYRFNGAGYLDPKHHRHIWIVDVPASERSQGHAEAAHHGRIRRTGAKFHAGWQPNHLQQQPRDRALLRTAVRPTSCRCRPPAARSSFYPR